MTEAIQHMNNYLEVFSTDPEAWHELAEMYIDVGSFQRAVFCYEELLLTHKHSLYHILTYAELLFSSGDFQMSRKYFSLACYLDGSDLRALWGLLMVNQALAEKDKSNEKMVQLQTYTVTRLKRAYKPLGSQGKLALALLNDWTA